jgi:GNAT superfamily N-acetyltransferase
MPISIAPTDPASTAAQGCLAAYFAELDARFPSGFDPGPPADPADYRPPRGLFLCATDGRQTLGCVALNIAGHEVKRLWVAPAARGLGLGPRLMAAVEDHARSLGLSRLRLDTHASLAGAIAMYHRLGWSRVPRYNDNPYAQVWFGKDL